MFRQNVMFYQKLFRLKYLVIPNIVLKPDFKECTSSGETGFCLFLQADFRVTDEALLAETT